ncbi:hypothetical protein D3C85_1466500 [compost metagenome]
MKHVLFPAILFGEAIGVAKPWMFGSNDVEFFRELLMQRVPLAHTAQAVQVEQHGFSPARTPIGRVQTTDVDERGYCPVLPVSPFEMCVGHFLSLLQIPGQAC